MIEEQSNSQSMRRRRGATAATALATVSFLAAGGTVALLGLRRGDTNDNITKAQQEQRHSVRRRSRQLLTPLPYDDPNFSEEAFKDEIMTNWLTMTGPSAPEVWDSSSSPPPPMPHTDPMEEFINDDGDYFGGDGTIEIADPPTYPVHTYPPPYETSTSTTTTLSDPTETSPATTTSAEITERWPIPIDGGGDGGDTTTDATTSSSSSSTSSTEADPTETSSSPATESSTDITEDNNLANATTTTSTEATSDSAPPRPPMWYPVEDANGIKTCVNNPDYPDEYTSSTVAEFLFLTESHCCLAFADACQQQQQQSDNGEEAGVGRDNGSGVNESAKKKDYWWPSELAESLATGVIPPEFTCTFGNAYPEEHHNEALVNVTLFETHEACCEAYMVECRTTTTTTTTTPTATDAYGDIEYWYPFLMDDGPACVFGAVYPAEYMMSEELRGAFLFGEEGGCCEAFPIACDDDDDAAVGVATAPATVMGATEASTKATATTTTTTPTPPEPCADCTWHESMNSFKTCTNSLSYPPGWDEPNARAHMFFQTSHDCCSSRYPGECTVVDVTDDSTFDGGGALAGLYDVGTPAQWELSNTTSYPGGHSITNIIPTLPRAPGMTSDLTIKITVTHHSTLRCMGKIDTSMPFDFFTLTINGQQRYSYHTKLDGWIQIVDRISPGENTIVFRVENSEDSYGFNRTEEYFGGGHVYLDDCEIFPS